MLKLLSILNYVLVKSYCSCAVCTYDTIAERPVCTTSAATRQLQKCQQEGNSAITTVCEVDFSGPSEPQLSCELQTAPNEGNRYYVQPDLSGDTQGVEPHCYISSKPPTCRKSRYQSNSSDCNSNTLFTSCFPHCEMSLNHSGKCKKHNICNLALAVYTY